MAARMLTRLQKFLNKTILGGRQIEYGYPALAFDVVPSIAEGCTEDVEKSKSFLDDFMDGFLWGAVPKSRRSRERRATRQLGMHKVRDYMTPKINLVECLDCGAHHESHTICGNCYQKIREETDSMKAAMDPDTRLFNVPQTEVAYIYKGEGEDRKMLHGKYVVELEKPRPEWFPKNLLTKGHGKY